MDLCICILTYTYVHMFIHFNHLDGYVSACVHTHMHIQVYSNKHTLIFTQTHSHMCACLHSHTPVPHTCTHTRMHAHMRAHTPAHARTCTHTLSCLGMYCSGKVGRGMIGDKSMCHVSVAQNSFLWWHYGEAFSLRAFTLCAFTKRIFFFLVCMFVCKCELKFFTSFFCMCCALLTRGILILDSCMSWSDCQHATTVCSVWSH